MLEQISALTSSTDSLLKSVSETRFMNGGPETAATGQAGETVSFGDTLAQVSQDAIQRLKEWRSRFYRRCRRPGLRPAGG